MQAKAFFVAVVLSVIEISNGGLVDGITACGGTSAVYSMELTNCTAAPCALQTLTQYEIALSFLSAETTDTIQWLLFLYYPNGGVNKLAEKTVTGGIEAGLGYKVADFFSIPERFNGIPGELSVMLMNGETGGRLTCGLFEVNIAPNKK